MPSIALPPSAIRSSSTPFRVLPGFRLSLGFTLFYLALIVLIPLSAVFLKTFGMTWDGFWTTVTSPRVLASYRLTFGASRLAAALKRYVPGAAGIRVQLRRAHAIGPLTQLEPEREDNSELIEAVIPHALYARLKLKDGETLLTRPKRLRVFVDQAS